MKITNNSNLPEPFVRALKNDPYTKEGSTFSVTEIIDSPRIAALKRMYGDSVEMDAEDAFYLLLGRAVHNVLDNANPDRHTAEKRLHTNVDGHSLSGQMDLCYIDNGFASIEDYKITSVWSIIYNPKGKQEWENQLNCYAAIAERESEVIVNSLKVYAILRDYSKRDAKTKHDYPKSSIVEIPIKLWDKQEREDYIRARVAIHASTLGITNEELLPECTAYERWEKPPVYAVHEIKSDGKPKVRATRLFDNNPSAESFIRGMNKKATVIYRPGESTRCAEWCNFSEVCSQYKKIRESNGRKL